jgi:hypothetical protein
VIEEEEIHQIRGRKMRNRSKETYGDKGGLQEVTSGGGRSLGLGVAVGNTGL